MAQADSTIEPIENASVAPPHHRQDNVSKRWPALLTWGICLLIAVIAMGFNLYRLGTPSIWYDEAFSAELARQPFAYMWHVMYGLGPDSEPNMVLYYAILHLWLAFMGLFGVHDSEFVARFPSVIFATLSAIVVFLLGRRFLGLSGGIIAAALYVLNDVQLTYAQQARAYSLQLLLICIAWYALLTALASDSRQKRWWYVYTAMLILSVYAHGLSVIMIGTQVLTYAGLYFLPSAWRGNVRRQWRRMLISVAITGVCVAPQMLFGYGLTSSKTAWLASPHLHDVYNLFMSIAGGSRNYLVLLVLAALFGVFVVCVPYLSSSIPGLKRIFSDESVDAQTALQFRQYLPVAFALACWFIIPVVFGYGVSQGQTRVFSSRYLIMIVPGFCLFVALGISALRWRVLQAGIAVLLVALALTTVPLYYKSAQVEDWNSTSQWLQQHYQANDGLICYSNEQQGGCQLPMDYYLHAYPTGAHFTGDYPGSFSLYNIGLADPSSSYDAVTNPAILAAYCQKHPHVFFITGRLPNAPSAANAQHVARWLDTHYHFVGQIVTRTVTIRLYDVGP